MSLLDRINKVSDNANARKAWFGLVVAIFVCIIVVPSIYVVTQMFTDWDGISDVLADSDKMSVIWRAVGVSFGLAFVVTVFDIIAGLPMAWIMVRKNFRGKNFLDTLLDMPLAFPTAVLGLSVLMFWGAPEGVDIPGLGLHLSTFMMLVLLHIIFTYPYMVRSLSGILEQIEPNYETAAMTLGASRWTAVRTITLPLFRAGLVTGFILCFARSLSETGGTYIALSILGVESTYFTGPTYITENKIGLAPNEATPEMILISTIMILLALLLLVAARFVITKMGIKTEKVWPELGRRLSRGAAPKLKDGLAILVLVLFVLVPSFYIFAYLADPGAIDTGKLLSTTGVSFLIAGVAVIFDIIFGIPVAIYIARHKDGKFAKILDNLVNIPLIVRPRCVSGIVLVRHHRKFRPCHDPRHIGTYLVHIPPHRQEHNGGHRGGRPVLRGDGHDPRCETVPGVLQDPPSGHQDLRHRRGHLGIHQESRGDRGHTGHRRKCGRYRSDLYRGSGQERVVSGGGHGVHNPDRHLFRDDDVGEIHHPQGRSETCLR